MVTDDVVVLWRLIWFEAIFISPQDRKRYYPLCGIERCEEGEVLKNVNNKI